VIGPPLGSRGNPIRLTLTGFALAVATSPEADVRVDDDVVVITPGKTIVFRLRESRRDVAPPPQPLRRDPAPRQARGGSRRRRTRARAPTCDEPPSPARRPPALSITLELEGRPRVVICADSFEDEHRLLVYLRSEGVLDELADVVERVRYTERET
jgi:hypothetical protein